MTARTLAAAALVALVGTVLAQQPKSAELRAAAQPAKADPKAEAPDLPKLLATRVTLDKAFDGPFKDAVKLLSEKYDLPLVIHPRLGEGDGIGMACDAPADDRVVKLPRLRNVRLDTVLKALLEQVDGKFLVYPDHIKLVPSLFAAYETGVLPANADANEESPFLTPADILRNRPLTKRALVNGSFKNKPLAEIVDEIAEATGANIVITPNVRQAPISVRFANAPVDAAVRTLCEMSDCAVIEDANVLLITTRERAAARAKEEAQKAKDRFPQQGLVGGGGFGLGGFPPDLAPEIAKLKEQNDQLKKELDELKKQLKK